MLIVCLNLSNSYAVPSVEVDVDPGDRQRGAAGQHRPPPHIRLHLERDEQVCEFKRKASTKFATLWR